MNVYDFDGTIYNGDSTVDFYLFLLRRHPSLIFYSFYQALGFILFFLRLIDKKRCKEIFFVFLRGCDAESELSAFWQQKRDCIFSWYLEQKASDDVVISASPEFLLKPLCNSLCISHLLASQVDPATGKFNGENCKGQEKVRRFKEKFDLSDIDDFYSDSLSDRPLAEYADQAWLIRKGKLEKWI